MGHIRRVTSNWIRRGVCPEWTGSDLRREATGYDWCLATPDSAIVLGVWDKLPWMSSFPRGRVQNALHHACKLCAREAQNKKARGLFLTARYIAASDGRSD